MSHVNLYESFRQWVAGIKRWIAKLLGRKTSTAPVILERYFGKSGNLFRLERNTYGAISTWRVVPRRGTHDLLVGLDSFRELKSQLADEPAVRGKKSGAQARKHPLTPEAKKLLLWQPNRDRTHLLWIEQISRTPVGGRISLKCVGIWAFDLEGFSPAWAGYERYATSIIRTAVKKLVSYDEDEFEVKAIDPEFWLHLIDASAKAYLGNTHQI